MRDGFPFCLGPWAAEVHRADLEVIYSAIK